jgi:hypothetical protein
VPDKIIVEGVAPIRKAIKALGDPAVTKEFKAAGKHITDDLVIPAARSKAAGLGAMYARAATTLRAANVAQGAAVRYGGGVAWAMGAEFGAGQNASRNTRRGTVKGWNQFRPWKGSGSSAGYFVWPTIHERDALIVAAYAAGIDQLADRLFPGGLI